MNDTTIKASEERLWELMEQRALPGADHKRIDQRIWDLFGEDWVVMWTDLAGFARQTAAYGIIHFLRVLQEKKKLLFPLITDYDGVVVRVEGDSVVALFRRPEKAMRAAVDMQRAAKRANERRAPEEQLLLCIGLGFGKVLRVEDHEVWGVEASAAQLLAQNTAEANQILITGAAHDACPAVEGVDYLDLGVAVSGSAQNYRVKY